MDWKQLVQFALQGNSDLEQYAILLVRVSIGLFFAISGGNKLFVAGGTKPVYETLVKAKVPFPRQTAYFVAGVEFACGSLVTAGFLSSPASVALLIDMTVATRPTRFQPCLKGFRLLTGSTISSTFRKSCTCSSLSERWRSKPLTALRTSTLTDSRNGPGSRHRFPDSTRITITISKICSRVPRQLQPSMQGRSRSAGTMKITSSKANFRYQLFGEAFIARARLEPHSESCSKPYLSAPIPLNIGRLYRS